MRTARLTTIFIWIRLNSSFFPYHTIITHFIEHTLFIFSSSYPWPRPHLLDVPSVEIYSRLWKIRRCARENRFHVETPKNILHVSAAVRRYSRLTTSVEVKKKIKQKMLKYLLKNYLCLLSNHLVWIFITKLINIFVAQYEQHRIQCTTSKVIRKINGSTKNVNLKHLVNHYDLCYAKIK